MAQNPAPAPAPAPHTPLSCRVTHHRIAGTSAADLVLNLEDTPEGTLAVLTIAPARAPWPTFALWLRPEELSALLLELAELHDLQAVQA